MSAECRYLIQSTLQNEKLATHVVYTYKYHFSRNSAEGNDGKSGKLEHFRYTDCFTAMEKKNRDVAVNNSLFPRELWNIILELYVFSWRDLIKFSCICKYWRDLSDHSFLWISCPITFHLSRRLLLYFLKDYSTNVNPTAMHQESFSNIVAEDKTNKNDQSIVENCLKTISTTNFYQYRHIYKDLNSHHHTLVNAAQISLTKRIDGPEIFDSNFILRNTTLRERECLAYDMNRKVLHLLKEYSAWWDWNYFYRPKISIFMKITEEWIPNRLFNQIIYWIGAICLLLLLLVFNEDSMTMFLIGDSFPSASRNNLTIPETSFPFSTDNPQPRLFPYRNLIGFGLVYLLLFSYLTLVVKILIEYFCNEYILSSRIKNSFVFIPVEFTLDWKHIFRKDSVILLFLNLTFLIVGLIVSVLFLQIKIFFSENPPMTSVSAILPHYLQVILCFFLSWRFILLFGSVIVFLFFFAQMKIVLYEYSSRNAHSSSSPSSHQTFSLSNQLLSNDALYSFFFYFLLLTWFMTSVGNVSFGNYFDNYAIQDTSTLSRENRVLELHQLTLYYFPVGFALLLYGCIFLLILLMLVLQTGINEMFVKRKLFTVPNMILLYCFTCGLVLVYSLTQLLLTGIGYSPEIADTSSTIPSYLPFSICYSSFTFFLLFLNGFYGCVVGTLFLNSNII
jgi:hypothetical protein